MNAQFVLEQFYQKMPNRTWEMDPDTFTQVRKLKSDDGKHLWQPSESDLGGKLLGVPVVIMGIPMFRMRYEFADGTVKYQDFEKE